MLIVADSMELKASRPPLPGSHGPPGRLPHLRPVASISMAGFDSHHRLLEVPAPLGWAPQSMCLPAPWQLKPPTAVHLGDRDVGVDLLYTYHRSYPPGRITQRILTSPPRCARSGNNSGVRFSHRVPLPDGVVLPVEAELDLPVLRTPSGSTGCRAVVRNSFLLRHHRVHHGMDPVYLTRTRRHHLGPFAR